MSMICEKKDISVIRGDVLEVYFDFNGITSDVIKAVYFGSRKAELYVECVYSKLHNAYCLRLNSDMTNDLKPTIASYDLVIELIDGNKITVIHEGGFAILKKRNALCEGV